MSDTARALAGIAAWLNTRAADAPSHLAADYLRRAKLYADCIGLTQAWRRYCYRTGMSDPDFDIATLKASRPVLAATDTVLTSVTGPPDVLHIRLAGEIGVADLSELEQRIARAGRIELTIDSQGGDFMQALALYQLLAGKNVTALVEDKAHSAAAFVLQAAKHRVARKDATIMLHDGQMFVAGATADLRAAVSVCEKVTALEKQVLVARTRQPTQVVDDWLAGPDRYFTAAEALVVGLLDEVVP